MARSYDPIGRLQSIATTTPASGTVASYAYQYNNLNQRTRVNREDGSYWLYSYNDRGELISGKKYWADNSPVWGAQTENSYDTIGNRTYAKSGGNQLNQLRQSTLTTNSLNQYSQRSVPGAVDITGTANSAATVTVNDQSTARKGDYFYRELAVDNTAGPVNAQITVTGARQNFGAGGEDAVTQQGGHTFLPQAAESFTFDFDGNLTSDGHWNYTWDAENRLFSMEGIPSVPVDGRQRLEFVYDAMARRVQKKVYAWNISTSTYQLQSTTRFVYDGWNLIAETDGSNAVVRGYVRGGGLLLINGDGNVYQVGYDGNQSVGVLMRASDGSVSASYDYDPFGQTLKAVGEFASQNAFRFSGQYTDVESGLSYYGFRYYTPQTGRWINRDPIEEKAGAHLYGFIGNDGINNVDILGLWRRDSEWNGGRYKYSGIALADKDCDSLSHLAELITGNQADWKALGIAEKVQKGQRVDISPLLNVLETKVRLSVVAATGRFNAIGFGPVEVTVTQNDSATAAVNQYFGSTPFGHPDCDTAVRTVLAKGLIDVLHNGEFDNLGWSEGNLPLLERNGPAGGMLLGDTA